MKKSVLSYAAVALLGLASATASANFIPFTVNQGVVPGMNPNSAPRTVDKISGAYTEMLGLTGPGTFAASAVGTFTGYYKNNGADAVSSSLGCDAADNGTGCYNMYAIFTATGSVTGPNSFVGTGGTLHVYLDPNQDSTFNLSTYLAAATVNDPSTDDIELGSSSISWGTGDLSGPPGAFNIYFSQFQLTAFGATYWTGLDTMQFLLQTNGDIDQVTPNPASNPPPYSLTGDFSANFTIPEPTSVLLVGVGLLGAGLMSRRRKV